MCSCPHCLQCNLSWYSGKEQSSTASSTLETGYLVFKLLVMSVRWSLKELRLEDWLKTFLKFSSDAVPTWSALLLNIVLSKVIPPMAR